MDVRTQDHQKIVTRDASGAANGYLVPLYSVHDGFPHADALPQQVYLTVIAPRRIKGPHLHLIRSGCFTCIRGNIRVVLKTEAGYQTYLSGEAHAYRSIAVPVGVPAALQNLGDEEAFVLNMPAPAWTPTMNDEHSADFGDFDFNRS